MFHISGWNPTGTVLLHLRQLTSLVDSIPSCTARQSPSENPQLLSYSLDTLYHFLMHSWIHSWILLAELIRNEEKCQISIPVGIGLWPIYQIWIPPGARSFCPPGSRKSCQISSTCQTRRSLEKPWHVKINGLVLLGKSTGNHGFYEYHQIGWAFL